MRVKARGAVGVGVSIPVALLAVSLVTGATAAAPCVGSGVVNASTTTSPNGKVVYGSPCADRIVVTSPTVEEVVAGEGNDVINANPNVDVIDAGAGDDVIYGELPSSVTTALGSSVRRAGGAARPAMATASVIECKTKTSEGKSCYGGDGSQEMKGGPGKDKIFGQRGNDTIWGEENDDSLYGGVGDDFVYGNQDDDLVTGGLGTETLDGNNGNDLVRGDGTTDIIKDTGGSGTDTLSYASGVTPGFHWSVGPSGFPTDSASEERGVDVRLDGSNCEGEYEGCNNAATNGGGLDNIETFGFENLIGSPYADVLTGSAGVNRIDGGGGTDIIYGKGGNDVLYGGPDGDYLVGEADSDTAYGQGGSDNCVVENPESCTGSAESVTQRDRGEISAGFMATSLPETLDWSQVFLTGSTGVDRVKAVYSLEGGTGYVTFSKEGESASFDTSGDAASENCTYESVKVKCTLPKPLDAITVAGMGGSDVITLEGFPETSTPVALGGEGDDVITVANGTEDTVVDNSGNDSLSTGSYDDALLNNTGQDKLEGGLGNDLLVSVTNCEGDTLDGAKATEGDGVDVNSASWAQLTSGQVFADLEVKAGEPANGKAGDAAGPSCGSGTIGTLLRIDDLEGSSGNDELYGDSKANNLLGRLGKDGLWGRAGGDRIEANDGIAETGGGGEGTDSCVLDVTDKFGSCNP